MKKFILMIAFICVHILFFAYSATAQMPVLDVEKGGIILPVIVKGGIILPVIVRTADPSSLEVQVDQSLLNNNNTFSPLTLELVDNQHTTVYTSVINDFTLITLPMSLPAGEYKIRLSLGGQLNEQTLILR